jgi:hypothetical protein
MQRERERESTHKNKQMNMMLCARQTLELCAHPSCPNPNNFAWGELFGGGGCRHYLRKSLRALLADPTTECCTYTLHVWESRRLWKRRPVLSWEWPAIEKQQCSKLVVWMYVCMYVCMDYIAWSELTSVFQCIAEHFDEILCSWKKNHSTLQNIYLWRKVVCFDLFCSYEIHRTGMLQIVFLASSESYGQGGGAWAWFHDIWTCSAAKVLQYWMISSLKIKIK